MSAQPQFITAPNNKFTSFSGVNSGSVTPTTIFTAGASGSWVRHINVTYPGTSSRTLGVLVVQSSVTYHIATVAISSRAGYDTTKAINICTPSEIPCMEPDPNRGILLGPGESLQLHTLETSADAADFTIVVLAGDF
jgi:hypothetical protein